MKLFDKNLLWNALSLKKKELYVKKKKEEKSLLKVYKKFTNTLGE
jgi:hypothetical protein